MSKSQVLVFEGRMRDSVADVDNMAFLVPFSTVVNGLWEMDKWEMGVGWLQWIRGSRVGNSWGKKDSGGNGG